MKVQKKSNMKAYSKEGFPQGHNVQISDFHTIEHAPHYSSSSRGGLGMDKTNYSLSQNHTKVPSNNSGYLDPAHTHSYNTSDVDWGNKAFKVNHSSRNYKNSGKLEQVNTDPSVFAEGHNSRNKYSNFMIMNNYHDQRNTYDVGSQMLVKNPSAGSSGVKYYKGREIDKVGYEGKQGQQKMNVRGGQRMFNCSDADEHKIHGSEGDGKMSSYDSPNSGSAIEQLQHAQIKKNYQKFVERNYRSGSGSTSGASMDGFQYMKNQMYPKSRLNVSDITEQQNLNLIHESSDPGFYNPHNRRHTGNRNSKDQQYLNSDSRKMSEFHTEESKMKTHVMGGLNVESRPQEMSNPSYNSENDLTVLEAQYREFELDILDALVTHIKETSNFNMESSNLSEQYEESDRSENGKRLESCLTSILSYMQNPQVGLTFASYFISSEGLNTLLKALDYCEEKNTSIIENVLKIINFICDTSNTRNIKYRERVYLSGFLPVILSFGGVEYPTSIKYEVAYFIGLPFLTENKKDGRIPFDPTHIKMLIGAGAVSTLVNFIDEDYDGRKEGDVVFMIAIDSINYLFT